MKISRRTFLSGIAATASAHALADIPAQPYHRHDPSLAVFISDLHINGLRDEVPTHLYEEQCFRQAVAKILALRPLPAHVVCFGDIAYHWGQAGTGGPAAWFVRLQGTRLRPLAPLVPRLHPRGLESAEGVPDFLPAVHRTLGRHRVRDVPHVPRPCDADASPVRLLLHGRTWRRAKLPRRHRPREERADMHVPPFVAVLTAPASTPGTSRCRRR